MDERFIANASIAIDAPVGRVWDAFVNPEVIKQYMFGTIVKSEWKQGSPIIWRGIWEGKEYEDKGKILDLEPEHLIRYSHFSPLSGVPDTPENYHIITVQLSGEGEHTLVSLSQDNNPSEEARAHSEKNWEMMLASLKRLLEEKTQ